MSLSLSYIYRPQSARRMRNPFVSLTVFPNGIGILHKLARATLLRTLHAPFTRTRKNQRESNVCASDVSVFTAFGAPLPPVKVFRCSTQDPSRGKER